MNAMKKIGILFLVIAAVISLVGCGNVVDGPGMENTEYEESY